ncbi:MAG: hypothetical protein CVT70_02050 [Alphaproteobacteria bacterium HGW-Alphaproteobacteria-1]|jgi:hypothetical protein|nr:MAG: hypothetical protein CVT70_02050 [Alphaproteobacteria bacterium HGW-Alphaproteobacteria-1]
MTLTRIIDALEESPAMGAQAQALARMGFLEWVFAMPGPVTTDTAREALLSDAAQGAQSAAARAFVDFLDAAARPCPAPMRRGRARWLN